MSAFGHTLFGGSRFIRWALSPFILLFAIVMPLIIEEWTLARVGLIAGVELLCFALLARFWLPARIGQWGFRIVATIVFLAYSGHLIDQILRGAKLTTGPRSQPSLLNALLGFLIIGLPSLLYAIRGRFTFGHELSPEQIAAERREFEERLLRPDWTFYETHLQRPAPVPLRELYADRAFVTAQDVACSTECTISSFLPLHKEVLLDTRDHPGLDILPFAITDLGDPIYLRPGASEPDKVYLTHHDGGDTRILAESVGMFLRRLRTVPGATRSNQIGDM